MITVEILDSVDKEQWNSMVKSIPEGSFYQTTYMAEWQKAMHTYTPLFLVAREGREIVGQLLFFESFYAAYSWSRNEFLKIAIKPLEKIFRSYIWLYGPLIFKKDKFLYILNHILEFLDTYIQSRGGVIIRYATPPVHNLSLDQDMIDKPFKSHGYKLIPRATVIVNTSEPIDKLWTGLKKGSRYDVKKASKDGILVEIKGFSTDALKKFHKVWSEAAKEGRAQKCSFNYLKRGLDVLNGTGTSKLFISHINNTPLSFAVITYFNGIMSQTFPLYSNYCLRNRLFGSHILTWKMLEWAHENNFRWFDFMGINPNAISRTPKEEGIFKFKTRWGGLNLHHSLYNKIFSQSKYRLIGALKKLSKK